MLHLFNLQNCPINSPFFFFRKLRLRKVNLFPESHTSIKGQISGSTPALPAPHRADMSGTAAVGVGRRDSPTDTGEDKLMCVQRGRGAELDETWRNSLRV